MQVSIDPNNWKDKMLGDLKEFSNKKYKPVGMHHLSEEINKNISLNHQLEWSHFPIDNSFFISKEREFISKKFGEKWANQIPTIKKDNRFKKEARAIIAYLIPIPREVFSLRIHQIKDIYKEIREQKTDIDYFIIKSLEKYGYWGVPQGSISKGFFGNLREDAIFTNSYLGVVHPKGYLISPKFGPRFIFSYVITNAPLKQENEPPYVLMNRDLNVKNSALEHLKYYFKSFGAIQTVSDFLSSVLFDNKFSEFVSFCNQCDIGKENEINLIVDDPLDYQK
ncbi:hypothetical protein JXR93_05150 [bacterium]|nr:hypothetical protein [bacterium]